MNHILGIEAGNPLQLGAVWCSGVLNVAVFSDDATALEVEFFDADGIVSQARVNLTRHVSGVWCGKLQNVSPDWTYAYRAYGTHDHGSGLWFDQKKALLDPYAQEFTRDLVISQQHLSKHDVETADCTPKCRFQRPPTAPVSTVSAPMPMTDRVIYEAHVKGFSYKNTALPEPLRGTYAGLAHPASIDYLKGLGINTLELLPVQSFADEPFLQAKGLSNYWGYNPYSFFAVHQGYASQPSAAKAELTQAIHTLREAGIDVLVDIVFNHTAEGDAEGSTLNWRGLDNRTYYKLDPDSCDYDNHTGCGNTLNFAHPRVVQLACDALRYWLTDIGVTGCRFDLASVMGRDRQGFSMDHPLWVAIAQDPMLRSGVWIAEPWDIGPSGYQLGGFPRYFAEWNDRFRDSVRSFWRGDRGSAPAFAQALHGSAEVFESSGRNSSATVNFVTSHDGFTARDLVSYVEPYNQANLENNRDGHRHNLSINYGVDGPTDNRDITEQRQRHVRNLLATTLLAQGVPLLLAGDERFNTQNGNNNAYCQDNELTWLSWDWHDAERRMHQWVTDVIACRKSFKALRQDSYHHDDWRWYSLEGQALAGDHWHNPDLKGLQCTLPDLDGGELCFVINPSDELLHVQLPHSGDWQCLLNSYLPDAHPAGVLGQITPKTLQLWWSPSAVEHLNVH
jgi:glycogen operon protein